MKLPSSAPAVEKQDPTVPVHSPSFLLLVVAPQEKVSKCHLALRITVATATLLQRRAIQKRPSWLTRGFHSGNKPPSFVLSPRTADSEEEGNEPVSN